MNIIPLENDDIMIRQWKVDSFTSDKIYTVTFSLFEPIWRCSCPHWKFRRAICKHIKTCMESIRKDSPKQYHVYESREDAIELD